MEYIFPKVAKCTFERFGPSGTIEVFDGLCVLPINIINEKIYIFLWFWFILLGRNSIELHHLRCRFPVSSADFRLCLRKFCGQADRGRLAWQRREFKIHRKSTAQDMMCPSAGGEKPYADEYIKVQLLPS